MQSWQGVPKHTGQGECCAVGMALGFWAAQKGSFYFLEEEDEVGVAHSFTSKVVS